MNPVFKCDLDRIWRQRKFINGLFKRTYMCLRFNKKNINNTKMIFTGEKFIEIRASNAGEKKTCRASQKCTEKMTGLQVKSYISECELNIYKEVAIP